MGTDPYKTMLRPQGGYPRSDAVTPHDSNELTNYADALYIGVAGDVKLTTPDGDTQVFKAVPVGILKVRAKIVFSIGTTATNILALY